MAGVCPDEHLAKSEIPNNTSPELGGQQRKNVKKRVDGGDSPESRRRRGGIFILTNALRWHHKEG